MSERTDPTRQAAQRLLAQIAAGPNGDWRDVEFDEADVRLVAEAVMERNNQSIIGEAHPAKGAGMCDCGRGGVCPGCSRSSMLKARSAENAETCASSEVGSQDVPSLREQHDRIMESIRTSGLPQGETEWRDSEYRQWSVYLARVVECPSCAFTFGAEHTDGATSESGYTCPCCSPDFSIAVSAEGPAAALLSALCKGSPSDTWSQQHVYEAIEPLARREAALQAEVVRLREALEGLNVGARHEFEWVEDARRPGVVNAVCKPDCAKCHAEALLAHDVVVPPGAALNEDA